LIEHTTGEGTTKILRIAAPAVRAHVANHDDKLAAGEDKEACLDAEAAGQDRDGGGTDDTCGIVGVTAAAASGGGSNTIVTVDTDSDVDPVLGDNWSVTLTDADGIPTVVIDASNVTVNPAVTDGNISLTVPTTLLAGLDTANLTVTTDDITCPEETIAEVPAPSTGTATLSGTVTTTKSGEPALKTSSGKTFKLSTKTDKGKKRLGALAKKDTKVKVQGKKSGDTLEVTKLKRTKAKK
jgi:hypothetical protein